MGRDGGGCHLSLGRGWVTPLPVQIVAADHGATADKDGRLKMVDGAAPMATARLFSTPRKNLFGFLYGMSHMVPKDKGWSWIESELMFAASAVPHAVDKLREASRHVADHVESPPFLMERARGLVGRGQLLYKRCVRTASLAVFGLEEGNSRDVGLVGPSGDPRTTITFSNLVMDPDNPGEVVKLLWWDAFVTELHFQAQHNPKLVPYCHPTEAPKTVCLLLLTLFATQDTSSPGTTLKKKLGIAQRIWDAIYVALLGGPPSFLAGSGKHLWAGARDQQSGVAGAQQGVVLAQEGGKRARGGGAHNPLQAAARVHRARRLARGHGRHPAPHDGGGSVLACGLKP